MAKLTLNDIATGYASTVKLNANNTLIESEFEKVLYRNNPAGEPNQMENNMDMNSNRILNLPDASNDQEPVTLAQMNNYLTVLNGGNPIVGIVGFPVGAIVFADTDGTETQDSANLFWDNTAKRLGIGTITPTKSIDTATDMNVGTTLDVGGAVTLASTLGVTGATTLNDTLAVTGATTLNDTLAVTGAATLSSTLDMSSNLINNVADPVSPQDAATRQYVLDTVNEVSGTWTPAITFATPGDLAVVYFQQLGRYHRKGNEVRLDFNIGSSSFTHSTASGNLIITGLPFTYSLVHWHTGTVGFEGVNVTGLTQLTVQTNTGTNQQLTFIGSRNNDTSVTLTASHVPSGGTVVLAGSITYTIV